jgi:hypothetical protein
MKRNETKRNETKRNTGGKKKADGGKGKKAKGGKKGAPAAVVAPTASSVITKLGASIGETLHTPVRKTPLWKPFLMAKRSIYQDRLGTHKTAQTRA